MRGYHIRISVQRQPESYPTNSFLPSHIFHHLPAHKPKSTSRRNALFNPANKDYRFGSIRLDWVDFEVTNKTPYTTMGKEREQGRGSSFECCLFKYFLIYPLQKLFLFLIPAPSRGLLTSRKGWFMCSEILRPSLHQRNLSRLLRHLPMCMMIQTDRCWASWQCHHG